MKMRKVFQDLLDRLKEPRRFIQCLVGPRQVGKTTLARQAADDLGKPWSGMDSFIKQFKPSRILLVGDSHGIPLEKFLSASPHYWFEY